jgi:hypothetical protein
VHLRLPVLVGVVAMVAASTAAAGEFEAPRFTISQVNWAEAATSLSDHGIDTPAQEFSRISAQIDKRFPGIAKSSVPVVLPMDVDAFRADESAGKPDALASEKYFGPFRPSKFFLPGPAGYMATFYLNRDASNFDIRTSKPVEVTITGAAFVYDLDGPDHQEVFPAKDLEGQFPGIKRILREAHVRYVFERFGVPYVVAIQCYDRRPSSRYLSCKEADPVAVKFLRMLRTAGGTPTDIEEPHIDLSEPQAPSDFTYYSPGYLIPSTGWHKMPGRTDYHVYARMRSPIADAPSYVKSQSFMPWGDCYRTGRSGPMGKKGAHYSCKVNDIPLVFDESAAVNFTYPWRDNFCEQRDFLVGQCPGGVGHQGEDIRPGSCTLFNEGADRCLPYQHSVAAARDGLIWRTAGYLAAYIVVNTKDDFVRFRYLHMNPKFMDDDGLLSGREVSEGEIIGKVGTWGDFESGTSYHIHFNMQVFTKVGWVWVNPYMSLVLAYERQIGGRGTEIKPGDPAPPVPDKKPLIAHPELVPAPPPTQGTSETNAKQTSPPSEPGKDTDERKKADENKKTDADKKAEDNKPKVAPEQKAEPDQDTPQKRRRAHRKRRRTSGDQQ